MMRGEIILENGSRYEFVITEKQVRKLEQQVQDQNEYLREKGLPEYWDMACELYLLAIDGMSRIPDPAETGTPAAGTAGEPR